MADVSVVGSGYVGLVTGACLAHTGHNVTCVDIDEAKVERLSRGEVPIYEPDLEPLVAEGMAGGRLRFTSDQRRCIPHSEFIFVAVQTPSASNGEADLVALTNAVRSMTPIVPAGAVLVQKSTAPIGTARMLEELLVSSNGRAGRHGSSVRVVSNPEFLREGAAVHDFLNPRRVIVGGSDRAAARRVAALYGFADCPVIVTDADTAEMIKYASNSFLAAKISFMNEIARICDAYGVDVREVAEGMGHDQRIGAEFLRAGLGWGGSCFPKDVRALIHMAGAAGVTPRILEAVQTVNADQCRQALSKLDGMLSGLGGAVVGLMGLSFKPGTDDLRHAPSLRLAEDLLERGAVPRAYDPVAMEHVRRVMPDLELCEDPYRLADGADALVLVTEWPQFRELDMTAVKGLMRRPVLLDGRNFWDGAALRALGFAYQGFGVRANGGNGAHAPGDGAAVEEEAWLP